jgi:hypothetical protein
MFMPYSMMTLRMREASVKTEWQTTRTSGICGSAIEEGERVFERRELRRRCGEGAELRERHGGAEGEALHFAALAPHHARPPQVRIHSAKVRVGVGVRVRDEGEG